MGVTASDGTATSEEQSVTISLSAVDDVTELALSLGDELIEDATEVGAIVASFVVNDPDNTVMVDFADGTNDDGFYRIEGNSIVLTDAGKEALDLGQSLPEISLITSGSDTPATASVIPTTTLINDAPIAVNDIATAIEDDGVITIDVLGNDTDEEGDLLTITAVSVPSSQGTVVIADGKLLFTPALNFNGEATISYTVSDGELTDTAEVSVSVSAVDDASVISGDTDSFVYEEDSRVTDEGLVFTTGKLTVTDVDIDDNPTFDTSSVQKEEGALGNLTITEDGSWTYTVDAANELQYLAEGQTLTENFTVSASDGTTEIISVTVRGLDDDAVIAEHNRSLNFSEDIPAAYIAQPFSLTISDVDEGDDPRFETTTLQGEYGYVEYIESDEQDGTGTWTYHYDFDKGQTLQSGQFTEVFTLKATDGTEYKITVNINGINDVPEVTSTVERSVLEGGDLIEGQVDATDVDSENLSFTVTNGTHPGFTLNSDGSWSFDPTDSAYDSLAVGVTEDVVIEVQVSDGENTVAQTITLSVTGTNDVPQVTESVSYTSLIEGQTAAAGIIDATDVDGDTLTYSIVGDAPVGFNLDGNFWTYDPSNVTLGAGEKALFTVQVLVDDGNGGTAVQTISLNVTGTNDAPVVASEVNAEAIDGGAIVTGTISATDADGDALTYSVNGDSLAGFTLDGNTWAFDPTLDVYASLAAGESQEVSVEILVSDGNGGTTTQTINFTVTGTNDAPTVSVGAADAVTEIALDATTGNSTQGQFVISDVDGDELTVSLSEPTSVYTSNGSDIAWSISEDGSQLTGATVAGLTVATVSLGEVVDGVGSYTVTLNAPLDHWTGADSTELALEFGLVVSDGVTSSTDTISVSVLDDVPTAVETNVTLNLTSVEPDVTPADSYTVGSISGGFSSANFTSASYDKTSSRDRDNDGDIDRVQWGDRDHYSSYYQFTDAADQAEVTMGETFAVAEFTHKNNEIYSSYSSLDDVNFNMMFNVEIDGVMTEVSLVMPLDHDETLNTAIDSNDTVTITSLPSTTVTVGGVTYEVALKGFMDSDGNIVTTISTPENQSSTYSIVAEVNVQGTDVLDVTDNTDVDNVIDDVEDAGANILTGSLNINAGADGLAGVLAASTTDVNGTLVITEDGSYTFTPSDDLVGSLNAEESVNLTYEYIVVDNDGDSVVNTLTIDVVGAPAENTAPEAADDVSVGDEDSVITIDVLANDSDAENDGLTITSATVAEELGSVVIVDGKLEFTPASDFSGEVTIDYTISDGELTSEASVAVNVKGVADTPTLEVVLSEAVSEGTITLEQDSISNLGSQGDNYIDSSNVAVDSASRVFDFGAEYAGQEVTISFDSYISGGWEDGVRNSSNSYSETADTYTISINGEQQDQFTYEQNTGTSSHNQSNSYTVTLDDEGKATVTFDVASTASSEVVNISNIQASVASLSEVSQLTITAAQTDTDGSETLTYSISALPDGAQLLDATGNVISANSDGSYSLVEEQITGLQVSANQDTASFDVVVTVTSTDGDSTSQTSQTVTMNNSNPIALDDYGFAGLVGSYYGTDSQLQTLDDFKALVESGEPAATFRATNIDYSSTNESSVASGTNLQSFLGDDAASLSADPDDNTDGGIHLQGYIFLAAGTYNFQVNADDGYQILIDGEDVASISYIQSPTTTTHAEFSIADDGYYAIDMLWWDQGGEYVFQPTISSDGGVTYATLDSSMLSSVKGAPLSTDDEHSITISPETLLANDSDADGDVLSISSISNVQNGYAYLNTEGNVVFIAAAGFSGTATFDYTVTDGKGGFDTATASIQVTANSILPTVTVTVSEAQQAGSTSNDDWQGFSDGEAIDFDHNGDYVNWQSFSDSAENVYIADDVIQSLKTMGGDDQVVIGDDIYAAGDVQLGSGDDKLLVRDVVEGTIDAGTGNDEVYIGNDVNAAINLDDGDDKLVIGGSVGSSSNINAGSGNDEVRIAEDLSGTVNLGDGNNYISVGDTVRNTITGGSGVDQVYVGIDVKGSINTNAGNDLLVVNGSVGDNVTVNMGDDDDFVVIGGLLGENTYIKGGAGTDSIVLEGYTVLTYNSVEASLLTFENIMLGDGTLVKGDVSAFSDYLSGDTTSVGSTFSYAISVAIDNSSSNAENALVNLFGIPATASLELNGEALTANTDGSYSIEITGDQTSIDGLTVVSDVEIPELELTSTVTDRLDDSSIDDSVIDDTVITDSYQEGTEAIDTLVGDLGDDVLFGGDDDVSDILTGGQGDDVFILNDVTNQTNIDTITDFNAADDALDLTDLLTGIEGSPGKDADLDAITEFLEAHVKVEDGAVKVDDEDVATFVDETSSFDSNSDGVVNTTDSIKVIYNNEEYNINIDG